MNIDDKNNPVMDWVKAVIILNELYRKHLHRDIDESGMKIYLPRFLNHPKIAKHLTENDIVNSEEYQNKFNSLAGDRVSYINSNDLSIIDNSPYNNIFTKILECIITLDNSCYDAESLKHRVDTAKQSIIHIGKKSLLFTIFPHLEFDFNTERFDNSLKNWKNFQYYVLFMCAANIWKMLFDKSVHTCGTVKFCNLLLNHKNINTFNDIFNIIGDFITDYLSIRIIGRILSVEENKLFKEYINKSDSLSAINYLQSLSIHIQQQENSIAINNVLILTEQLKRKPKVLIMIAYLETQNRYFLEKMIYHINKVKEYCKNYLDIDFALDNDRVGKEPTDYTPWSRVKRIRNLMINKYDIKSYDYLYIIDSDIIYYPHNFLLRAIGLNPTGITAPLALIENSIVFYDWCGYQKKGATSLNSQYKNSFLDKSCQLRNFNLQPPYVDDPSRLVEIDCVGCTYVVPSSIFSCKYGDIKDELIEMFRIAKVNNHKIADDIIQYEDHPTFTDHYTICAAIRSNGGRILMDRGSPAYHADLPIYGEAWH